MDKVILKDIEIIKNRNKFRDKKAIRGDIISTKSILTIFLTIHKDNMKIKDNTKKIKDIQIAIPTKKVVEEAVENMEEVTNEKESY